MKAAVVIPALNEADTIAGVVAAASAVADPIVVDDGSTDTTAAVARAAGAAVVSHPSPEGYDAALRTGFAAAAASGYDLIASIDADGELDPGCLPALLDPLVSGAADLSLGDRGWFPRWSERLMAVYARARFHVPDLLCGAKAFTVAVYRQHVSSMDGASIGTGLAVAALRAGARAAVVAVTGAHRADRSRFGSGLRPNLLILRALVGHLVGEVRPGRGRPSTDAGRVRRSPPGPL